MIIISWDVGIIHLAYCILEHKMILGKYKSRILDWDIINLIDMEDINYQCCGHLKNKKNAGEKICDKKASFIATTGNGQTFYYCKTHLSQYDEHWTQNKTKFLFKKVKTDEKCAHVKSDGTICEKNSTYYHIKKKIYYCSVHYKSVLNKQIKEFSPKPIKNLISSNFTTADLQLRLIKKLDELVERFAALKIEEVIIENQPSQKNPRMKSIANTLFDYFLIRGYIDKVHGLDIKLVRFICPSNKLKVNDNNTIEVFKSNKDSKKKYKLTKALSVQYTKQLLQDNLIMLQYLSAFPKQDDMCDAYLQGLYYLEFMRNKLKTTKKSKTKDDDVIVL
jgi:hypothetical protein